MTNTICLNEKYSSTRLLTKEKPITENKPEDKFETVLFLPEGENRKGEGGLRTKGYFKKSYNDKPLISIITVVFNGEKYLEETIVSVIDQTYNNVEYLIVDGGSTDGTLDIIKKYENQIDYWVSEKDNGIYDAMNKAVSLASGKWINFMNAGDSFYSIQVLVNVSNAKNYDSTAVIYGDTMRMFDKYAFPDKAIPLTFMYKGLPFVHQSSFVRKEFLVKYPFDIQYKICADHDFFYKLYSKKLKYDYVHYIVSKFDMDGVSSNYRALFLEEKKIEKKYGNNTEIYFTDWRYYLIAIKTSIKYVIPKKLVAYIRFQLIRNRTKGV